MPSNTFTIDLEDTSLLGKSVSNLHSEFQIPAILALKDAIDNNQEIEQIKRNSSIISKNLLDILPENPNSGSTSKPSSLRDRNDLSTELTDEEKAYLKQVSTSKNIESVIANLLLAINEKDITQDNLRTRLSDILQNYKTKLTEQTALDMSRTTILVKGQDGEVNAISNVNAIDTLNISGAQKDFIKNAWHQGTFECGWVASTRPDQAALDSQKLFADSLNNNLLIDLSEDKVRIYNSSDLLISSFTAMENKSLHSKGTLEVDISSLTGDKYFPCMATTMPKITALVTEFDPELSFGAISTNQTDSQLHDSVRNACIEGELNAIINKHQRAEVCKQSLLEKFKYENNFAIAVDAIVNSKESDEVKQQKLDILKEIQPQLIQGKDEVVNLVTSINQKNSHATTMKAYCLVEHDTIKREAFAPTQFDKFSETCTGKLDDKEKDRIKKVVIDIMKPLCKDKAEESNLEKNAGKMVRECASQTGITKSWSQAWSKFKDGIKNVVNYILGRENQVTKIMSEHPNIQEALKTSLKTKAESPTMSHTEKLKLSSEKASQQHKR